MKPVLALAVMVVACCAISLAASTPKNESVDAPMQADRDFLQASANGNGAAAAKFLDDDFLWTNPVGKVVTKADFLQSLTNSKITIDSNLKEHVYGDVTLFRSSHDKTQVSRIWVKRNSGWRLLTYDETTLIDRAGPVTSSGVNECENPCKTLPYTPKNDAERGIITSWQALETAVTHHDASGWGPHIADEFILINANNDHPMTKSDRMAVLDTQKQSGAGAAPVPLVSAKMFDFADTVVMTAQHQRGSSKPIHVTRIWIKRDGQWLMAFSQQTTIQ